MWPRQSREEWKQRRNSQGDERPPRDIWESARDEDGKPVKPDIVQIREYNLSSGKHYYIITDIARREFACTTCPVRHGGILEARLLKDYKIKDGILYLRGVAINETP